MREDGTLRGGMEDHPKRMSGISRGGMQWGPQRGNGRH
jgi:hypothetical protein